MELAGAAKARRSFLNKFKQSARAVVDERGAGMKVDARFGGKHLDGQPCASAVDAATQDDFGIVPPVVVTTDSAIARCQHHAVLRHDERWDSADRRSLFRKQNLLLADRLRAAHGSRRRRHEHGQPATFPRTGETVLVVETGAGSCSYGLGVRHTPCSMAIHRRARPSRPMARRSSSTTGSTGGLQRYAAGGIGGEYRPEKIHGRLSSQDM